MKFWMLRFFVRHPLHPRSRLAYAHASTAVVAELLWPIALPALALYVGADTLGRQLQWKRLPRPLWAMRLWWWYAYRGPYQLDWWLKSRARRP